MTAGRSWLRLALRRLADEPALAGAAIVVALVASTIAAACVVYPDTMLRRGLLAVLGAADPAASAVIVTTDVAPSVAAEVDAAVEEGIRAALAPGDGPVVRTARSTSWQLPGGEGLAYPPLTVFAWDEGLAARTALVEGAWPTDEPTDRVEAVVTAGAAEALGLAAGSVVEVASRLDPDRSVDVVISGVVRVLDAADPAWGGDRLALDGAAQPGSFPLRGPLFVTRDALLDKIGGRDVTLGWRALPVAEQIAPEDVAAIRDRVAGLGARLERDLGRDDPVTIATGLTAVLDEAGAGIAAGRSGVAIIALQLLFLAAYALVLLASLVAAQRRAATELAAARGAAASTVLGLAALEGLLVAIPAVALGPFLAVVLVGLLTGGGGPGPRLAPEAIALALVAGLVTVAAMALPAATALGPVARFRGRLAGRGARSLAEQTGIDLALVALAALGLWQLHENGPLLAGAGGRAGDVDPLLAAAPAIGLLAGGLLALRVGPLVGAWLERPASTARGAVVALAGRGISRRAAEAGRAALLLVVATALVLFTAAYGRTWARSQVDQVAAAQAADLVGTAPTGAAGRPGWIVGDELRALPGVEEATPASRATFSVGTAVTRGTLLAAPADAAARSVQTGRDPDGRTFADLVGALAAERPAVPAVAVPAGITSLGLHVDAGLAAAPGADGSLRQIPVTWRGLVPSVVVRDGTGMLHRLAGEAGRLAGGRQVLEVPLETTAAGRPARLVAPVEIVGVDLELLLPDGVAADGTIRLDRITAAGDPGAEDTPPLELDLGPAKAGWSATRGAIGVPPEPLPATSEDPLGIALGEPAEGPAPVLVGLRRPPRRPTRPCRPSSTRARRRWSGSPPATSSRFPRPRRRGPRARRRRRGPPAGRGARRGRHLRRPANPGPLGLPPPGLARGGDRVVGRGRIRREPVGSRRGCGRHRPRERPDPRRPARGSPGRPARPRRARGARARRGGGPRHRRDRLLRRGLARRLGAPGRGRDRPGARPRTGPGNHVGGPGARLRPRARHRRRDPRRARACLGRAALGHRDTRRLDAGAPADGRPPMGPRRPRDRCRRGRLPGHALRAPRARRDARPRGPPASEPAVNARAAIGGPLFLARTGLRAGGRDAILAALVIGVTAFLVSLAPLWFGQAADDVLLGRLLAASVAQRGLEFELSDRLDPGPADPLAAASEQAELLAAELPPSLAAAAGGPDLVVDSTELLAVGAPRPILRLTLRMQDVGGDVRWVAGREPGAATRVIELEDRPDQDGAPPPAIAYEAALSTETAATTGLGIGDRVLTVPGTNTAGFVAVDIVGLFEVVDPADARWFSDPTLARTVDERISQEVTEYHAVALVDPGVYPTLHGASGTSGSVRLPFRYRWRFQLDPARLAAEGSAALEVELARLRAAHPFGGGSAVPGLSTGLADLVEDHRIDRAAAAATVAVALVGPLAAMLGMLAVVVVAAQRRRAAALVAIRARGGGSSQAIAGRVLEAFVVALPVALAGGLAAGFVVSGGITTAGFAPSLVVASAAVAFAGIAAAAAGRRAPVGRQAGPGGRRNDRRLVLDLLIVAIAAGGAVSLLGRGAGPGGDLDLGLVAAVPALLALAGAVVVLRAYPSAVRLVARAAAARPGFVAVHALRGVERGAAGHDIPLLALVLAIATGTFAALVIGSIEAATELAAAEQIGADVRVEQRTGAALPPGLRLADVPGVEATAEAALADGRLAGDGPLSVPVTVVVLDVPAWLRVVEGLPLGEAIPVELVAAPPVDVGADDSPVAALVDAATLARLGISPGQSGRLTVGGRTVAVRAAGPAEMVPGADADDGVVIVDRAAADAALPGATRRPVVLYARAGPRAEAAISAEVGRFAPAVVLASRAAVLRELRAAPLGVAARAGFGAAIAVALLYAMAVLAIAARQAISARRRELAVLVALGLPSRRLVGMLAVEIVPLVVAALAAGLALGGLVAALVVPDLALGRLVGQPGSVALAVDPRLLVAFVAAPIAAAAAALVAGAVSLGRADLAAATRAVEA